jgi:hypothetical protein
MNNKELTNQACQSYENMNWTQEELKIWYEAGLIPHELLAPERMVDLASYMKANKKKLYERYQRDSSQDNFIAIVPPQEEWHKAPDLKIIDKRTGEVVQTLEMSADFKLCDGVCLKIKAKELPEWEKETATVKHLTKEENETLKASLDRIGNRPLTRKEIVTLIEEVRKPQKKPKKYRQSGHLVDQKLKCRAPNQPSLFEDLLPETQQKISEARVEIKAEGIKLSYAENKLVHALNLLLFEKSQNTDPKSDSFYSGNAPSQMVPYGPPDQTSAAPVLKFKPAELYKAFMGTENYSGSDVKFIIDTLYQLEEKKVLIKYDRVKKVKEGKKIKELTDRIEDFQSLIKIMSFIPDLSSEEKTALDNGDTSIRESKGEIIIVLNPIFRDQIDTKYIEFPEDAQRRLVIAAGGHKKVTASMQTLMEYMLREISAGRYSSPINVEKLPYILKLENYVLQKRKKKLQERIEKDVQAIVNMGIIQRVEKQPNSVGGIKWIFHLNKDYD